MQKKPLLLSVLAVIFAIHVSGQLQRLAIMPQSSISISAGEPAAVKSLCIDYFRDVPSETNNNTLPFNQVFTEGGVTVKLNGQTAPQSFQSLVQSDPALLLLQPLSAATIRVLINPAHPDYSSIKTIQLDFTAPVVIGNNKDDRDVSQAALIFRTWGNDISQEDFSNRSKCLDVLAANKKMVVNNGQLSESTLQACNYLVSRLDLGIFPDKAFKALVAGNYLLLDAELNLTPESINGLKQAFEYFMAVNEARNVNEYGVDMKTLTRRINEDYTPAEVMDVVNLDFKDRFYKTCQRLTDLSRRNTGLKDTTINGARYVLMVAWKSKSFEKFITPKANAMSEFLSDKEFFKYPLFLTTRYDIEQFNKKHPLKSTDISVSRTRLMQMLGLPPNSTNDVFMEFWVKEGDVFRPAIDSSLGSTLLMARLSTDYIKKFADFAYGSYKADNVLNQYPFTGLGYTWDCHPASIDHFGVSEFVLKEGKTVYVRRLLSTADFVKGLE